MIREGNVYLDSFEKRWSGNSPHDDKQHFMESLELVKSGEELSIKVAGDFSSSAAAKLLEQEIREVVSLIFKFITIW